MSKLLIPATIIPNDYVPLVYGGFNGMYIYSYNNPEDIVLHPRCGNGYNTNINIYASIHSGNIQLFNNGKKVWINVYELIEQNEKFLYQLELDIEKECRRLRKQRLGIG